MTTMALSVPLLLHCTQRQPRAKCIVMICPDYAFHVARRLSDILRSAMPDVLRLGSQHGHGIDRKNDEHCSRLVPLGGVLHPAQQLGVTGQGLATKAVICQ